MGKTLGYKWFGLGKLPQEIEEKFHNERMIITEEGIKVMVYFDHYKSPGKNFKKKVKVFAGSICLTEKAFYGSFYNKLAIGLEWKDPRFSAINISADDNYLSLKFDAAVFSDDASGIVNYRFKCDNPQQIFEQIQNLKK